MGPYLNYSRIFMYDVRNLTSFDHKMNWGLCQLPSHLIKKVQIHKTI